MITALIAPLVMFAVAHGDTLICPVIGNGGVEQKGEYSDYNGVRYWYCCGGCKEQFEKEPAKFAKLRAKDGAAGVFLFDPVTGSKIDQSKAIKEHSDFKGVRFLFASKENKALFDRDPIRYGTLPEQEALYCSPGKEVVPTYGFSSGYVDHKDVRYYMCCAGCEKDWARDTELHANNSKAYVKKPGIATEKPKADKSSAS